jgi:hypothetical protein
VLEHASVEGNYELENAEWGATPDMTIPANAVTGQLVIVDDGTAADSLGCGALDNTADFAKGDIINFSISAVGTGYSDATGVDLTGGEGTGATADITVTAGGEIATVTIVTAGENYEVGDILTVDGGNSDAQIEITDATPGKIAVVYRGDCEFGEKALNANNAGAIAVIIVNNVPGSPVGMAAGSVGDNVDVPVIMITQETGALLRDEIDNGNVVAFIGSKQNLYENDLGIYRKDIVYPGKTSIPSMLANDNTEFSYTPGVWVYNYGSLDQTTGTVNVTITRGATELYNETATGVTVDSGDSTFVSLPIFGESSYPAGLYEIVFTVAFDSQVDEFPGDNVITTSFLISDEQIYANAQVDENGDFTNPSGLRALDVTSFGACIVFKDDNASRLMIDGLHFSLTKNEAETLDGEYVYATVWQWAPFVDLDDPAFENAGIEFVGDGEYSFDNGELNDEYVFAQLRNPDGEFIVMEDDTRYIFCVDTENEDVYVNFDSNINYFRNLEETDRQPYMMIRTPDFSLGFLDFFGTPAMGVQFIDAAELGLAHQNDIVNITPYPNPAVSILNIPVQNLDGAATLEIVDVTGRSVKSENVTINGSNLSVDVADIPNGTYLFNMNFENGKSSTFRVVINK